MAKGKNTGKKRNSKRKKRGRSGGGGFSPPRKHDRVPLKMDVELVAGDKTVSGKSRDISAGGMYVESAHTLPNGSKTKVRFVLDPEAEAMELDGKVAWTTKKEKRGRGAHPKGMGVEFVEGDDEKRMTLFQFVNDLADLLKILTFTSKHRNI